MAPPQATFVKPLKAPALAADKNIALENKALAALKNSDYLALRFLSCDHRDGVLTVKGRVPSYYLKQLASTALARLEGVERVDNQVEVA